MDMVTQVQIWDKAVCILYDAGKSMNSVIPFPVMGK